MDKITLDLIPVAYFVLDEGGRISEANDLAAELTHLDRDDLAGRPFADLVSDTDTWRLMRHLRVANDSGTQETIRIELHLPDESRVLTHLHLRAQQDENCRTTGYHAALVTASAELAAAKDAAEEMSRLKSAFLANMSHEIRTPLTGIIGFASVLAKELPDEHREFAGLIQTSGRRLMEMLNSVLDLAKLEAQQMQLENQRIEMLDEAQKVVEILRSLADDKNLTLEFSTMGIPDPLYVRGDRAAFHRILHNLIGNAIKFTDEGSVTVEAWIEEDRAGLEIKDTGVGMDADFLPHVFEEFRQESSGVMRSHQGSGLGLAITRRLVDLMGGDIDVRSVKGNGTTFRIAFQRDLRNVRSEPAKRESPTNAPHPRTAPARLLLVEDHTDTQQLLMEVLEDMYEVSVAGQASEAFLLASQRSFDVILMDINLGEGPNGTELLRQLRALPEYAEKPIVAVTAYALPGDRERFLEMGFTAYVSKPFDVDELLRLPLELS